MQYLKANNTTVTQLFFGPNGSTSFALDLTYSNGKLAIQEKTSAGQGGNIISDIDATEQFNLLIEYYPEKGYADITVTSGEQTISQRTYSYYSENTKALAFSSLSIYSLISADTIIYLDNLCVYSTGNN